MGAQDYPYNYHMGMFNRTYLTELLEGAGFKEVCLWDPGQASYYTFQDSAFEQVAGKPISLNLEAIKK